MPLKLTTTTQGEKKRKEKKISTRIYRTSEDIGIIHVFLESCCQSLSLAGSHSPSHLPRMPSNTVLISGPAVGAAQILICSFSSVFLPQPPELSELVHFLLWELSMSFYIFHRHRACPVDHMDLICSLYNWWEGFGSFSLATLPLGFDCGFISTSTCGLATGV